MSRDWKEINVYIPPELSAPAPAAEVQLRLWPPQLQSEAYFGRHGEEPHCFVGWWREADRSAHYLRCAFDIRRARWCAYADVSRADAESWFEEVRATNGGFLHWWDG